MNKLLQTLTKEQRCLLLHLIDEKDMERGLAQEQNFAAGPDIRASAGAGGISLRRRGKLPVEGGLPDGKKKRATRLFF